MDNKTSDKPVSRGKSLCAAAMVGREQDVGTQPGPQREFGLLPGLQITGEQGSALPCSG